ncbi:hypothetical protein CCM_06269 [Cordyceps militaris CM01]|uniref:Autophagy-related 33 n=2 Tax=Cordyceps militaris TaxID=73501 RepID=G3JJS5_CORMM|nr:uncharacterized protein CCM_06269 [Cordyceps militaris CM01]ATY58324.1 hypothetical protein A9K55_003616 [Cordyceps militaris]EGX92109.1 hypothetical protein CCM_06269 [Cordyceps militaris CM01]
MALKAIPLLKFVGTVSLGLLTGVSYAVSRLALPALLSLPSSAAAGDALSRLGNSLRAPLLTLSSLAALPLALAFVLAPRHARHPYLVYASVLAAVSAAAPRFLVPAPAAAAAATPPATRPKQRAAHMEASYEVLGDVHSEPASEEDMDELVNGEDVRGRVQGLQRAYAVQAGLAGLAFAMSVVGLWGDGAPVVVVS